MALGTVQLCLFSLRHPQFILSNSPITAPFTENQLPFAVSDVFMDTDGFVFPPHSCSFSEPFINTFTGTVFVFSRSIYSTAYKLPSLSKSKIAGSGQEAPGLSGPGRGPAVELGRTVHQSP